ncbi:hypothetical protein [Aliiglaciecola sp. LCG003]|uniref:hypothetical protein n=1 Tax=Aliiglaciecola sp. LCG003 TaxID=3053655 RepID=UPI0025729205|nr:hypothetical protein [Aliiglaciecola sp. LCG003]WJG10360.1 hypothetical protein QR722_04800 [Aliiglaciecola sp. LCG003]
MSQTMFSSSFLEVCQPFTVAQNESSNCTCKPIKKKGRWIALFSQCGGVFQQPFTRQERFKCQATTL